MKLAQQIADSFSNKGLNLFSCVDSKGLLQLVGVKKGAQNGLLPYVYLKETNADLGRADDFFLSVLLVKSLGKDSQNFQDLFKVASSVVSMITLMQSQESLSQNADWIVNTHPAIKIAHIYYQFEKSDPFAYNRDFAKNLVEMIDDYAAVIEPQVISQVFDEAVRLNAIDLALPLMQYNVKTNDENVCRNFFSYLLRGMPSHYYHQRKEQIIDVAKLFVSSHHLEKLPIDIRNPKMTVFDYIMKSSVEEKNPANACVHIFNEKSFTDLFDSLEELSVAEKSQSHQSNNIFY